MYVYFITGDQDHHPIKIGRTSGLPYYRIRSIQHMSPVRIKCLGIIKGHIDLELQLHNMFYKSRMYGEWFKRTDELIEYIKDNAKSYDHENTSISHIVI